MNSFAVFFLLGLVAATQASVWGGWGATLVGPANPGAVLKGPAAQATLAGPDGSLISAAAQAGALAAAPIPGGAISAAVAPGAIATGGVWGAPGVILAGPAGTVVSSGLGLGLGGHGW